jgi:hypothetical protein
MLAAFLDCQRRFVYTWFKSVNLPSFSVAQTFSMPADLKQFIGHWKIRSYGRSSRNDERNFFGRMIPIECLWSEVNSCSSQFLLFLRKWRLTRTFSFSFPMDQKTIVLFLHMKLSSFRRYEEKSDGISCREFIRASRPHSGHFEDRPGWDLSWDFSRVDETIAKI